MFTVYVIKNSESNKIYIGHTQDLETRLKRHNGILSSKTSSYTSVNRVNGIWKVIFKEEYKTRKEAMFREKQLKTFRGREFVKNLI